MSSQDSIVRTSAMQNTVNSPCSVSYVLGYNRLVDHVGIHDQRRLTEALNNDSLVRRKEYPMESSSKSRKVTSLFDTGSLITRVLSHWYA
ncbi:hypothetical protein Taro_008310 [Colocasia esculenta]|uniref:Uncharacterized protein n=1 Tax=Colocasia esculenta TaxID=4460 RepID=A0A843U200_COLES|nr:hypothetical protein [Colocasia esculenta]